MRVLKITGLIVSALLGLVALVLVAVWLLFDPNHYKAEAEAAFLAATGRSLRLEGKLAVSIFPWLAVETGAASIADRDGFGREPFASLENARVGVRLWPLLSQRRVAIDRVTVDRLRVHLQVKQDGTDNWSDVIEHLGKQTDDKAPEAQAPGKEPVNFSIGSLHLTNSQLTFVDRQAKSSYAIDDWTFATGRLERSRPVAVQTTLRVTRNEHPVGDIDLRGEIDLSQPGTTRLAAVAGKLRLAGLGPDDSALPLEIRAPLLTMDNATRDIKVENLEARLDGAAVTTSLQVRQGKEGPTASGPLRLAAASPRRLLAALGVTAPQARDPAALSRLSATSQLKYSSREGVKLTALDVRLDDARCRGNVAMPDLSRKAVRFDLSCNQWNVDRYLPPPAATPPSTIVPKEPRGDSGRAGLRALDAQGSLDVGRLVVAAVTLQDVQTRLAARDGVIRADPIVARVFGGRSSTRLNLDLRGALPSLHVDESFHDVDVAAALGQLAGARQLEGRGSGELSLALTGRSAAEMQRSARGQFDLTVEDGALVGVDLWHEIEKAVAKAQGPGGPVGTGSGRTPFTVLQGRGTLADRTLHNDRLEFVSDFARVTGHGKVNFGANQLDLDLTARLLKAPEGRLLGMKVSRVAGTDIPLEVTGPIDDPKVKPDVNALLGAAAKSVVTDPLEGKLRQKLEKLLGR